VILDASAHGLLKVLPQYWPGGPEKFHCRGLFKLLLSWVLDKQEFSREIILKGTIMACLNELCQRMADGSEENHDKGVWLPDRMSI
jgi:hypothetical protein